VAAQREVRQVGGPGGETAWRCSGVDDEISFSSSLVLRQNSLECSSPASFYKPPGSAKANGREPKSCFGLVFSFKLGCFVMCTIVWPNQVQLSLEWKTRLKFCPVN